MSINRWMDKEDVIPVCSHTYDGILLSHKKEWSFVICNNMDGLGWYFAKWNKSDRGRQILYDIYVDSKKI